MNDLISKGKVLRCLKESSRQIDCGQSRDGDAFKHYIGANYRTIAEFKPEPPQWIRVEDRLPDDASDVLAYYDYGGIGLVKFVNYYKDCWYDSVFNDLVDDFRNPGRITHWMPLPEPPEEVKHDE